MSIKCLKLWAVCALLSVGHVVGVAQSALSDDESAVLSAWLSQEASLTNRNPILLNPKTSVALLHVVETFEKFGESLREQVSDKPSEVQLAVSDFLEKNGSPASVLIDTNIFPKNVITLPVSEEGVEWAKIQKEHPNCGGVIALSRIGMDPSKKFAVMFVEDCAGPLSVFARFVVLERKDGRWRVTNKSIGPRMYG